ncbi:MAG: glycosyltransferase family 2 protein [Acidobacteria bacterium]|nr:glycosyltransferase family 2 protein [Acidobacteriota bacterium]
MSVAQVAAVVVSYNTREDLLRCLASLRRITLPLEAVVVDNASADGSVEAVLAQFPHVRVIASAENLGFSRANNLGLRETRAPHCLVLNSDAEVRPGAVETLVAALDRRPDVGIVGPRTVGSDGGPQVSFGPALTPLSEWRQRRLVRGLRAGAVWARRAAEERSRRPCDPDWVSGSCFLARRGALEAVGGFDEGYFLYEEDVDLCVRVRGAGWRVAYEPAAEVVHHLGRSMETSPSRARLEYHRSHLRYYRKHNGPLGAVLLRGHLTLLGVVGWLKTTSGADAGDRRREAGAVLRLGLLGR